MGRAGDRAEGRVGAGLGAEPKTELEQGWEQRQNWGGAGSRAEGRVGAGLGAEAELGRGGAGSRRVGAGLGAEAELGRGWEQRQTWGGAGSRGRLGAELG